MAMNSYSALENVKYDIKSADCYWCYPEMKMLLLEYGMTQLLIECLYYYSIPENASLFLVCEKV